MELSNPLRPKNLRPLPSQEENKVVETPPAPTSATFAKPLPTKQIAAEPEIITQAGQNDEIRKAIALLSKNGIQLAGPKKVYAKHSFELEKDVFEEFMRMYPALGQKRLIKEATTEAFKLFNDKYRADYLRIKKS